MNAAAKGANAAQEGSGLLSRHTTTVKEWGKNSAEMWSLRQRQSTGWFQFRATNAVPGTWDVVPLIVLVRVCHRQRIQCFLIIARRDRTVTFPGIFVAAVRRGPTTPAIIEAACAYKSRAAAHIGTTERPPVCDCCRSLECTTLARRSTPVGLKSHRAPAPCARHSHKRGGWGADLPPNTKLYKMQQNTD